jgi:hypothetical protein
MPPECPAAKPDPQGAAPRPASRTPHDAPFEWTRWEQCNRDLERGDKGED